MPDNILKPSLRRKARSLALQAIYQWQFTHDQFADIAAHFLADINPKKIDSDYFTLLLQGVMDNSVSIDSQLTAFLDRSISDLDQVELAILRLAVFELMFCLDVPYKVVINEALELTKIFGSVEGFKYVNGILDKVAAKVRSAEKM
jgi:transcription antitermination protein NusB